jgi:hypothetical protein
MSYLAGTPLDLEYFLAKEIAGWVAEFRLKSPADQGETPVPVEVVQGFVPSYYAGPEEGNQDKAPCIAVRVVSAAYLRERGKATVNIMLLTWDRDTTRVGYQDTLNLANHLIFHLQQRVAVAKAFVLTDDPITFTEVVDPRADFFPYFVGGISASFFVPAATSRPPLPSPKGGIIEGGTSGWTDRPATPPPR